MLELEGVHGHWLDNALDDKCWLFVVIEPPFGVVAGALGRSLTEIRDVMITVADDLGIKLAESVQVGSWEDVLATYENHDQYKTYVLFGRMPEEGPEPLLSI